MLYSRFLQNKCYHNLTTHTRLFASRLPVSSRSKIMWKITVPTNRKGKIFARVDFCWSSVINFSRLSYCPRIRMASYNIFYAQKPCFHSFTTYRIVFMRSTRCCRAIQNDIVKYARIRTKWRCLFVIIDWRIKTNEWPFRAIFEHVNKSKVILVRGFDREQRGR